MVGIELPVLAMEHHYLLTEDIPELQGRAQEIVNTTDYSGEIYMRQERGGALIGTYEPHGKVWSPVRTPDDFSMQLLPDEFERLAPYFEVGFEHFPALGRAGIRKAINGPFTFAPDGNPLVGPVRGLRNYWVACAVMAGFSQGGGIGLVLSRWMTEGDPGQDILSMDVARFGRVRDAEVHVDQGARELRPPLPPRLSERGTAGGAAGAPFTDPRSTARGRRRHGRELRPRARAVVCAARHRAGRDADLSSLRGVSQSCARNAAPCAARPASTRPPTTASTRSRAAARAPGSTACSPAASRGRDAWRSRRC